MVIYIIVLTLILVATYAKEQEGWNRIVVFFLCFLGLFRSESVGKDVPGYLVNIHYTTWNSNTWNYYTNFEDGYNILIALWNSLFDAPMIFLGLCNVVFVLSVNNFAKKNTENPNLFLLFLYLLGLYFQSYNIMRQYFALALILLSFAYIDIEKPTTIQKTILLISILIVGYFFHNSIFVFVVLFVYYLLPHKFITKKAYYVILLFSMFFFLSKNAIVYLEPYMPSFILNEKTTIYMHRALEGEIENVYSNYRIILDTIFVIYVVYIDKNKDVFTFLLVMSQIVLNIISPLNPLFARVSTNFLCVSIIVLTRIYKSNILQKNIVYSYCFIIFVNTLIKNYGNFIPYQLN